MKKKNISVFAGILLLGMAAVSCQLNSLAEYGTLVIRLPGSGAARLAGDPLSEGFSATLSYRVDCEGPGHVSREFKTGSVVTIPLPAGEWAVTVTVLNAAHREIGASETRRVTIQAGKTEKVEDMSISVDTTRCGIADFRFTNPASARTVISEENSLITVYMPAGTVLESATMVAFSVVHEGAEITPSPVSPQPFGELQRITVFAENRDLYKTYTLSVIIGSSDEGFYLGESLALSGQVYVSDESAEEITKPYAGAAMMLYSECGGTGEISGSGAMNFTIGEPVETVPAADVFSEYNLYYTGFNFSANDANMAVLHLRAYGGYDRELLRMDQKMSISMIPLSITYTNDNVVYYYVDRDVTITAKGAPYFDEMPLNAADLNLVLKKGWNAVYTRIATKVVDDSVDVTVTTVLGNPALKWVLQGESYEADSWPDYAVWQSFGLEGIAQPPGTTMISASAYEGMLFVGLENANLDSFNSLIGFIETKLGTVGTRGEEPEHYWYTLEYYYMSAVYELNMSLNLDQLYIYLMKTSGGTIDMGDLPLNEMQEKYLAADTIHRYNFFAVAGTVYRIEWLDYDIDSGYTDINVGVRRDAYSAFIINPSDGVIGYDMEPPVCFHTFLADVSGIVTVEVHGSYSLSSGAYQISYRPMSDSGYGYTDMPADEWLDGYIPLYDRSYYRFYAQAGINYRLEWVDYDIDSAGGYADITVGIGESGAPYSIYQGDGEKDTVQTVNYWPVTLSHSGYVFVEVSGQYASNSEGSFKIRYTVPPAWPSNAVWQGYGLSGILQPSETIVRSVETSEEALSVMLDNAVYASYNSLIVSVETVLGAAGNNYTGSGYYLYELNYGYLGLNYHLEMLLDVEGLSFSVMKTEGALSWPGNDVWENYGLSGISQPSETTVRSVETSEEALSVMLDNTVYASYNSLIGSIEAALGATGNDYTGSGYYLYELNYSYLGLNYYLEILLDVEGLSFTISKTEEALSWPGSEVWGNYGLAEISQPSGTTVRSAVVSEELTVILDNADLNSFNNLVDYIDVTLGAAGYRYYEGPGYNVYEMSYNIGGDGFYLSVWHDSDLEELSINVFESRGAEINNVDMGDLPQDEMEIRYLPGYTVHNYRFYAEEGTIYRIDWVDSDSVTDPSYADVLVGVKREGYSSYIIELSDGEPSANPGNPNYHVFFATFSGYVTVEVSRVTSGIYGICYQLESGPGAGYTEITAGEQGWYDGVIYSSEAYFYRIYAQAGIDYRLEWVDSDVNSEGGFADIVVGVGEAGGSLYSLYWLADGTIDNASPGQPVCYCIFQPYSTGYVYVEVRGADSSTSGNFQIRCVWSSP